MSVTENIYPSLKVNIWIATGEVMEVKGVCISEPKAS